MNSGREEDKELIQQVVRGERPWTDLASIGIDVQFEGNRCLIANPRGIVATADVHDVAAGLLAHQHDPHELQEWAYILEASSTFLDLDVEQHPSGDALLDAVWRASFGEPLPADIIQLAEQLVHRKQSHV